MPQGRPPTLGVTWEPGKELRHHSSPVFRFEIAEDDAWTLITDGVAEAQDAEGLRFGLDGIAYLLRRGSGWRAPASTVQALRREDDIAVLT